MEENPLSKNKMNGQLKIAKPDYQACKICHSKKHQAVDCSVRARKKGQQSCLFCNTQTHKTEFCEDNNILVIQKNEWIDRLKNCEKKRKKTLIKQFDKFYQSSLQRASSTTKTTRKKKVKKRYCRICNSSEHMQEDCLQFCKKKYSPVAGRFVKCYFCNTSTHCGSRCSKHDIRKLSRDEWMEGIQKKETKRTEEGQDYWNRSNRLSGLHKMTTRHSKEEKLKNTEVKFISQLMKNSNYDLDITNELWFSRHNSSPLYEIATAYEYIDRRLITLLRYLTDRTKTANYKKTPPIVCFFDFQIDQSFNSDIQTDESDQRQITIVFNDLKIIGTCQNQPATMLLLTSRMASVLSDGYRYKEFKNRLMNFKPEETMCKTFPRTNITIRPDFKQKKFNNVMLTWEETDIYTDKNGRFKTGFFKKYEPIVYKSKTFVTALRIASAKALKIPDFKTAYIKSLPYTEINIKTTRNNVAMERILTRDPKPYSMVEYVIVPDKYPHFLKPKFCRTVQDQKKIKTATTKDKTKCKLR